MSNSATETTRQPIWQDRAAQASLGLAIVLNLFLFILVLLAYRPLNQAAAGLSGAIDPATALNAGGPFNVLILPIIGLVSWLAGGALGVYYYNARSEAPMAYIIWSVVALIGLATWLPALSLILNL
jgi:hypothetical protein